MASRKSYECFVCKRQGFEDVQVFLDGKDDQGKTIYKNEDMTSHIHKQQQQQQSGGNSSSFNQAQTQQQPKQTDYDKSVDNGISAFSMMTDLIRLFEQTQKQMITMNEKLDRLLNLAEIRK